MVEDLLHVGGAGYLDVQRRYEALGARGVPWDVEGAHLEETLVAWVGKTSLSLHVLKPLVLVAVIESRRDLESLPYCETLSPIRVGKTGCRQWLRAVDASIERSVELG
jgi:hypothetical protein